MKFLTTMNVFVRHHGKWFLYDWMRVGPITTSDGIKIWPVERAELITSLDRKARYVIDKALWDFQKIGDKLATVLDDSRRARRGTRNTTDTESRFYRKHV